MPWSSGPKWFTFLLLAAVEEGHNLTSGTGAVGAESGVAGAFGDFFLQRPENSLVVVLIGLHICEGVIRIRGLGLSVALLNLSIR